MALLAFEREEAAARHQAALFFESPKDRALAIYKYAVEASGVDWHGKSLLHLAISYVEWLAVPEHAGVEAAVWELVFPHADPDLVDTTFGMAWDMLVKDGYAGGEKR